MLGLLRLLRCHQWQGARVDRLGLQVGFAVRMCGGDVADGVSVGVVEERAVWPMVGAVGLPMLLLVQIIMSNSAVLDASAVPLVKLDPHAAEVVVHRLSSVPEQVAAEQVVPCAVYLSTTLAFVNPRQHWQG